jgi:serine protease Do
MNGLPVGANRNFKGYCNVIRTAGKSPIAIEVLRFDTSEYLRGEINGEKPLEQHFSFADQLQDQPIDSGSSSSAYTFELVTDDTGGLQVEMPVQWGSRNTAPLQDEMPVIMASPNLDSFGSGWDVPGIMVVKLPMEGSVDEMLDAFNSDFVGSCSAGDISDYSDGLYTGKFQVWASCGGTETVGVVFVATPASGAYSILLLAQVLTDNDVAALQRAFDTFIAE